MSKNQYDKNDRIQRNAVIWAGALKMAAYRLRDPETDEWGPHQFHVTYDNHVLAFMSEKAAKLFAKFVDDTLS